MERSRSQDCSWHWLVERLVDRSRRGAGKQLAERGEHLDQGVNWWKGVKGRDVEDGTSEQGTRSKGQPQAGALQLPGNDAAIGGGSTSEGMDEQ
jgi:hypothetical protein